MRSVPLFNKKHSHYVNTKRMVVEETKGKKNNGNNNKIPINN